jgi:hypothetical protein
MKFLSNTEERRCTCGKNWALSKEHARQHFASRHREITSRCLAARKLSFAATWMNSRLLVEVIPHGLTCFLLPRNLVAPQIPRTNVRLRRLPQFDSMLLTCKPEVTIRPSLSVSLVDLLMRRIRIMASQ